MAGIVSFKVYLYEDGESSRQEVRRFGIDSDVVTNFEYFQQKLQSIFANLKGKRFSVYWKDSDGDAITISSDEELVLALNETALEPVRKVYVEIPSDNQLDFEPSCPSTSPGTLHIGVVCDGCNGLIRGFRFKCIQCRDYDLCAHCQSQAIHPEHCMLRLVNPLDSKAHFGRRFVRHMNKFAKKHTHLQHEDDDEEEEEEKGKDKGKAYGHKSGHKKLGKHQKQTHCPIATDSEDWIKTFLGYFNEPTNIPVECPVQESKPDNKTKDQPENQPKPNTSNFQKNHNNSSEHPKSKLLKLDKHVDVFNIIGHTLTHFLGPLSIDMNIQAKTPDNQTPDSTNKVNNDNSNSNVDSKAGSSTPSTSKSNSGNTTPKKFNERNDVGKENNDTPQLVNEVNNEPNANKKNVEYVMEKEGHSDPEWTLVKEVTPETKEPLKEPSAPLYPLLPEEKEIYHPNPKIQKAVETMMQMGFPNDNGQLTNLLMAKDGDIISVLDILQRF